MTYFPIVVVCDPIANHLSSLYRLVLVLVGLMGSQSAYASWLPSELPATPIEAWQPMKGDVFVVDTDQNMGYLLHQKTGYTMFPVATGQRKVVHYAGRTYDATTPSDTWTVASKEIQNDRITFGKRGFFMRLSSSDGTETLYGIHSHAYIERMLASPERWRSMGCVLVSERLMDTIMSTYALNLNELKVVTVAGFGEQMLVTEPDLRDAVAQSAIEHPTASKQMAKK